MSVRMTAPEVASFLADRRTGILTSLRRDGHPLPLPMWFVVLDELIHFRTRANSTKVRRLERDPRVSFLVEDGEAWADLVAVNVVGTAVRLDGPDADAAEHAIQQRYARHGVPDDVPQATRSHYDVELAHYRIDPSEPPMTWRNAKLLPQTRA